MFSAGRYFAIIAWSRRTMPPCNFVIQLDASPGQQHFTFSFQWANGLGEECDLIAYVLGHGEFHPVVRPQLCFGVDELSAAGLLRTAFRHCCTRASDSSAHERGV